MERFSKRAISDIVSTVLIIMIAVVAVGIIGAVIVPMIRDNLGGGTLCNQAIGDLYIDTGSGFSCVDLEKGLVVLHVAKGSEEIEYAGAKVSVISEGNSYSYRINSSFPTIRKTFYLNVSDLEGVESVEMYPIVLVGQRERVCGMSSTVVLGVCDLRKEVVKGVEERGEIIEGGGSGGGGNGGKESESGSPVVYLQRIYPHGNKNVIQNEFFNITLNVTCLEYNCGDVNVSFDPEINVTEGLIGYWPLDGNLSDLSENQNYGEFRKGSYAGSLISLGDDNFIDGKVGTGFYFNNPDPTIGSFISLSQRPLDPRADNFAFSFWIKVPQGVEVYQNIFDQIHLDSWYANHRLGINTAGELSYGHRSHQVTYTVGAKTLVNDNEWRHVVVSANGTHIIFYINGKIDSNASGQAIYDYVKYGTSYVPTYFRMGEAVYWASGAYSRPYQGFLDEFAIWDRSLSEEEVKAIYNDGAGINLFEVSKGLISDTIGDTPFYTNQTNPRTINLNAGQSQLVTAWVNATGNPGEYTFFEFANLTSNMSISSMTSEYSLSIL
jgi:hypothetical protein